VATSAPPAAEVESAARSTAPVPLAETRTAALAVPAPQVPRVPWASAAIGLAVGLATGLGVRATYPPARHMTWLPASIFGGSAVLVGAAFLLLVYRGRRRSADWFAAAYLAAIVFLALLDVGFELLALLVVKAPGLLGVSMIPHPAPVLPVSLVATLAIAGGVLGAVSYGLWCLEALPRLRVVLAVIGLLCLVVAAGRHGYWLAGGPPAPVASQVQQ
jgi:hypothetical protein